MRQRDQARSRALVGVPADCDDSVMTIPDNQAPGDAGAEVIVSLDDGEIYLRQDGPPDAPALLLIHGNASSARWWDELVPLLIRVSSRHQDRPPRIRPVGQADRPQLRAP